MEREKVEVTVDGGDRAMERGEPCERGAGCVNGEEAAPSSPSPSTPLAPFSTASKRGRTLHGIDRRTLTLESLSLPGSDSVAQSAIGGRESERE